MELHERRQKILAAVVNDYVETAEPVGSENLARRYDFGVGPATIRNELAAISEMGYLRQPHTSAGRVPSDMGYRYYVDQLMPTPALGLDETYIARQSFDRSETEVEEILLQTCRILSALTNYISVATPPKLDTVSVMQVALLAVKPGKLLVITVLSTGQIDHRTIGYEGNLSHADVISLGNLINARCHGADIFKLAALIDEDIPMDMWMLGRIYKKAIVAVKQALSANADDELFVEGTSHILRQPEFSHSERANKMMEALEERRTIYQILSSVLLGKNVTVVIGTENTFHKMQDCSFVATKYSIDGYPCGSVGVIGPTRMDYRRAVAAVCFMASNLSDLLTSLSWE